MFGPGRAGFWICALICATACSKAPGAANETPVDPVPGSYEISRSGKMFGVAGRDDDEKPHSVCVKPHEAAEFPYKLAEGYAQIHPGCTKKRAPRQGNKIAGVMSCPADRKMAAGMNDFIYDGEIAAEEISVSMKIKFTADLQQGRMSDAEMAQMKLVMKALERARLIIEATRVGDC